MHVKFIGEIPNHELRIWYNAADVFCLASYREGWANVILESMACGIPVIASDVGGNAQVICNENLGTVIPFGSPERLTKAISEGLSHSWNAREIRQYAKTNNWNERVKALLGVFSSVTQCDTAEV